MTSRTLPVLAAVLLGCAALTAVFTMRPAAAASSCSAAYSVTSQWSTGFGVSITITNGSSAVTAWTVQYTYPGNQQLTDGWDGTWSQSGETVTVTNASWNGSLSAGGSTTIGANFSYSGSNTAPATITCTGNGGPAPTTSPTPTASPSPTPTPTPTPTPSPSPIPHRDERPQL